MDTRILVLKWKDAAGFYDIFSLQGLNKSRDGAAWFHRVESPRNETIEARCITNRKGNSFVLDYSQEHKHNSSKDIELGILRLDFKDNNLDCLEGVFWKSDGDQNFHAAEIEVEFNRHQDKVDLILVPDEEPIRFYKTVEQRSSFMDWMSANPDGFVLNWPKSGTFANDFVKFHRCSCRPFRLTAFPNESFYKLCHPRLSSLATWALNTREFPQSILSHAHQKCIPGGQVEFNVALEGAVHGFGIAIDIEPPDRIATTTMRIVRDTAMARDIKAMHDNTCQLCKETIEIPGRGRYSEAHHLRPLGGSHKGLDVAGNIVCVCPNCHVKLDYGAQRLQREEMRTVNGHLVDETSINYHNQFVFGTRMR